MPFSKYLSPLSFLTSEDSETTPLSPSSISPDDSPLSPSPTSSNNSPHVESPPSSPGHEYDLGKCPANNEPPSPPVPSKVPFFDVIPSPKEFETCGTVLGFPIPDEWFLDRYQVKKATGVELESYGRECAIAFDHLPHICERVCDEMWPEGWIEICGTSVWCLRDGKTETCLLIQIGTSRQSPPFDVSMEMVGRLAECGIGERLDWYPECGKFQRCEPDISHLRVYFVIPCLIEHTVLCSREEGTVDVGLATGHHPPRKLSPHGLHVNNEKARLSCGLIRTPSRRTVSSGPR